MSNFSSVLIRNSYDCGKLVSCLRVHISPIFIQCPHSSYGALSLVGTTLVGSWDFGESIFSDEEP